MILSGTDPPGYELVPLREGVEFSLYRGRQEGTQSPVLVVAMTAEYLSPQSLRRLEHEYSFAAEVDPAWAAKPLALTRHEGRAILVLKDPGGDPLDLILERGQGKSVRIPIAHPILSLRSFSRISGWSASIQEDQWRRYG
jgi:hypothetical protein